MESIRVKMHVGIDGILRFELPIGVSDVDCEVVVTPTSKMTRDEWLAFLEQTAGSLADDPIARLPQGMLVTRD